MVSFNDFAGKVFFVIVVLCAFLIVGWVRLENVSPFGEQVLGGSGSSISVSEKLGGALPESNSGISVEAFFCPQDSCADKLIKKIDSADKNIFVAIYSFTHDGVADALIRAKERGVEVMVVFDYDQAGNDSSDDEKLFEKGVRVARRNGSGYMHNKFAVIDARIVATGSFNYSMNADTKNEENLVFIESAEIASKFKADFDLIWGKSFQVS